MRQLWAPWRMEYIKGERPGECIFCMAIGAIDKDWAENLLLYKGRRSSVILNKYPYNNGHLMVFPNKHVRELSSLNQEETLDIFSLLKDSIDIVRKAMKPGGFNVGINLGKCAGAGIEGHLHIHLVPRWEHDTNFMPIIGEVKVISEHLKNTYDELSPFFRGLEGRQR